MSRVNSETQGLLKALRQKMAGLKLEVLSMIFYQTCLKFESWRWMSGETRVRKQSKSSKMPQKKIRRCRLFCEMSFLLVGVLFARRRSRP